MCKRYSVALVFLALALGVYAAEPTTTVLTSSASPVLYGQPLTLTATVSPPSAPGVVTIYDGVTLLETEPVSVGAATLKISQLAPGVHSLTARYIPSIVAYSTSTSPVFAQTITAAPAGGFSESGAGIDYYGSGVALVGDFNGDGKADIAIFGGYNYDYRSAFVSVALGNGDGSFQGAAYSPGGNGPVLGAAIGDFNGDGKADVVLASGYADVLLGKGDGTFSIGQGIPIFSASSVAVGDFNGDGIADICVGSDNMVSIVLGNGDGTFGAPVDYFTNGSRSIVVGDFNGDGIADLAVDGNGVNILLGNGDGTFQAAVIYSVVGTQGFLAAGDFNGDGKLDLAVPNSTGIAILLGNGDGTFQPGVNYGSFPVFAVAVADFNDDGKADLAVIDALSGSYQSNDVYIFNGNGDGTFQAPVGWAAGAGVSYAAVGEFNGDGAPDIAAASFNEAGFGVLLSRPGPCLQVTPQSIAIDAAGTSQTITLTSTVPSCAWTATSSAPWIQLSSSAGTGSGGMTVTIPPNTTGADLTGTISFQAVPYGTQTINITERFEAQTFTDVLPSSGYFDAVELMAGKGITSGCTPTTFCPSDYVTRAQMAIFIVRTVMGGDNFTYTETPYFADVPVGAFGFQWIQKLRDLGITSGCSPTLFCPADDVTRAQMAIFMIRARYGTAYDFDYSASPYYTDVPVTAFGFAWIQRMKQDSITSGCTPTTYCPSDSIVRSDMATFVMRAGFNELLPTGEPVITSISPTTIAAGTSGTYTLTGLNTGFTSATMIEDMPGITVSSVNVLSPTSLTMQLTAAGDAVLQPVSTVAITSQINQEAVLPNGLVIQ